MGIATATGCPPSPPSGSRPTAARRPRRPPPPTSINTSECRTPGDGSDINTKDSPSPDEMDVTLCYRFLSVAYVVMRAVIFLFVIKYFVTLSLSFSPIGPRARCPKAEYNLISRGCITSTAEAQRVFSELERPKPAADVLLNVPWLRRRSVKAASGERAERDGLGGHILGGL